MVRFRIISIFLLFLPVSPLYSEIISVVQGEQGNLQVRPGVVSGWITQANFTKKFIQTGWNYLDFISNERYEDDLQAVGAGLAEGYLTSQLILHYYKEFIAKDLCIPDPKFCTWVLEILHTNKKWALEQEVSNKTDYWKMVRLFYKQMEGMKQGLKMKNPDKTGLELVEMKYEDIVLLINFLPNLGDFLQKYKSEKRKVSFPSCSALIKVYEDNIIISHSTWHEYRSLHYRLLKRYILNFHDTEGQLIPGYKISMSSYAGSESTRTGFGTN
ncbi:putative phospholipase B-like 2 isoform X6 [Eurytemora carolleeae]|uniref:putative phospholipase B-like 2 isoform X6 n=1 Tax=Eurytemora carolleeae TaxID=1294199 RepID=UPI000C75B84E|nr:putative phospholipase B-like 2 isoform X6 [Eurytemora carolleeae]|eukprot:XP_023337291.1 putative phospholipase B-like 2 isoform X6 [Eurytemora affinis]